MYARNISHIYCLHAKSSSLLSNKVSKYFASLKVTVILLRLIFVQNLVNCELFNDSIISYNKSFGSNNNLLTLMPHAGGDINLFSI